MTSLDDRQLSLIVEEVVRSPARVPVSELREEHLLSTELGFESPRVRAARGFERRPSRFVHAGRIARCFCVFARREVERERGTAVRDSQDSGNEAPDHRSLRLGKGRAW